MAMLQEKTKKLIFVLYSWLIYNSYLFITAPILIFEIGLLEYFYLLGGILFLFYFVKVLIYDGWFMSSTFCTPFLVILLTAAYPFSLWWRKQSFFRAWLLAFSGMFCGTGANLFFDGIYHLDL